jgi:uncharacterized protein (DUF1778 family)
MGCAAHTGLALDLYGFLPYSVEARKHMAAPARKQRNTTEAATARLEARISKAQKSLIERAAELRGQSVTDFVRDSLQQAAIRTVEEHNVIRLTLDQQQRFVEALLNPPAPNAALRAAAARYKQMTQR